MDKMLKKLKPRERKTLELYYYKQKKVKEISKELKMNVNTVKVTLMRAKAALKELFTEFEPQYAGIIS